MPIFLRILEAFLGRLKVGGRQNGPEQEIQVTMQQKMRKLSPSPLLILYNRCILKLNCRWWDSNPHPWRWDTIFLRFVTVLLQIESWNLGFFSICTWHEHIKAKAWFIDICDCNSLLSLPKKFHRVGFLVFEKIPF